MTASIFSPFKRRLQSHRIMGQVVLVVSSSWPLVVVAAMLKLFAVTPGEAITFLLVKRQVYRCGWWQVPSNEVQH